MGMTVEKVSEANQLAQLRQQFFDALVRKEQITRDLAAVETNVLALTNVLAGAELAARVAAEAAEAAKTAKA